MSTFELFPVGSRLFVGNVINATEDEITRWFSAFGPLAEPVVKRNSFAFVQYADAQTAAAAIAGMHGRPFGNRQLDVKLAMPDKAAHEKSAYGSKRRRDPSAQLSLAGMPPAFLAAQQQQQQQQQGYGQHQQFLGAAMMGAGGGGGMNMNMNMNNTSLQQSLMLQQQQQQSSLQNNMAMLASNTQNSGLGSYGLMGSTASSFLGGNSGMVFQQQLQPPQQQQVQMQALGSNSLMLQQQMPQGAGNNILMMQQQPPQQQLGLPAASSANAMPGLAGMGQQSQFMTMTMGEDPAAKRLRDASYSSSSSSSSSASSIVAAANPILAPPPSPPAVRICMLDLLSRAYCELLRGQLGGIGLQCDVSFSAPRHDALNAGLPVDPAEAAAGGARYIVAAGSGNEREGSAYLSTTPALSCVPSATLGLTAHLTGMLLPAPDVVAFVQQMEAEHQRLTGGGGVQQQLPQPSMVQQQAFGGSVATNNGLAIGASSLPMGNDLMMAAGGLQQQPQPAASVSTSSSGVNSLPLGYSAVMASAVDAAQRGSRGIVDINRLPLGKQRHIGSIVSNSSSNGANSSSNSNGAYGSSPPTSARSNSGGRGEGSDEFGRDVIAQQQQQQQQSLASGPVIAPADVSATPAPLSSAAAVPFGAIATASSSTGPAQPAVPVVVAAGSNKLAGLLSKMKGVLKPTPTVSAPAPVAAVASAEGHNAAAPAAAQPGSTSNSSDRASGNSAALPAADDRQQQTDVAAASSSAAEASQTRSSFDSFDGKPAADGIVESSASHQLPSNTSEAADPSQYADAADDEKGAPALPFADGSEAGVSSDKAQQEQHAAVEASQA